MPIRRDHVVPFHEKDRTPDPAGSKPMEVEKDPKKGSLHSCKLLVVIEQ